MSLTWRRLRCDATSRHVFIDWASHSFLDTELRLLSKVGQLLLIKTSWEHDTDVSSTYQFICKTCSSGFNLQLMRASVSSIHQLVSTCVCCHVLHSSQCVFLLVLPPAAKYNTMRLMAFLHYTATALLGSAPLSFGHFPLWPSPSQHLNVGRLVTTWLLRSSAPCWRTTM